ncbi:MAG: DNA alkylation repair protein [Candidatus Nealsonbacteria bacterium]|nr:DNA alkylation repair protein [Candidatus Nealsonbacteria bacterium]
MDQSHQEILRKIKRVANSNPQNTGWYYAGKYMGTPRPIYNITNPQVRQIAKKWVKEHKDISLAELLLVLNSFFEGKSHTERTFGGKLLEYLPTLRKKIEPRYLDRWLTGAKGWSEVDSLCQSIFTAEELLNKWDAWKKLLKMFVKHKDVHKRRAALVLLTKPVRESNSHLLADMAFENIDKLKSEKDILITKAVSWLIRALIQNHRQRVAFYIDVNKEFLPKIAVRETRRKLLTGKK